MFPFNRDRKLSQPLGQWNENYATDFQWYWRICSTTFNLYHYTQSKWKIYCPHTLQCTFVVYKQVQVAPTDANIPNNPATPLIQPNQLIITLPIARAPTMWHTEPPMEPSLLRQLTNPVHTWERSLQYQIRPHANIYQLHEQLARGQKLVIVSDALVNHKGHGTLAWIIHTDKKLWSGEGIAPGPPSEMYSGLAEVYGVYTAISFLAQYESTFPIMYYKRPRVYVCCDNNGVIERINQAQHGSPNPNNTVSDNYGIFKAIDDTRKRISSMNITFLHVLGHQDQKQRKRPLSLEERLNVECNAVAAKLNDEITNQIVPMQHPMIPQASPHLVIKQATIARQTQQHLQNVAMIP